MCLLPQKLNCIFSDRHRQGKNALEGVHPDYVYREGASRINHSQRTPYSSAEIQQDPEVFRILSDSIREFCEFVETNVGLLACFIILLDAQHDM